MPPAGAHGLSASPRLRWPTPPSPQPSRSPPRTSSSSKARLRAGRSPSSSTSTSAPRTTWAPRCCWWSWRHRTVEQVLDAVSAEGISDAARRGCTLIDASWPTASTRRSRVGAGCAEVRRYLVVRVPPEAPILAAPTVAEVARRWAREPAAVWRAGGARPRRHREVARLIVAAMDLATSSTDHRRRPGDHPGRPQRHHRRQLAAHLSRTYPAVSRPGAHRRPDPRRGAAGSSRATATHPPVIAIDGDTYRHGRRSAAVRGRITARSPRKIATAVGLFEDQRRRRGARGADRAHPPDRVTPLMFEHELIERARADRRHIVLPEGDGRPHPARGRRAAPLRCGRPHPARRPSDDVQARAGSLGLTLPGRARSSTRHLAGREDFAATYHELRKHKGITADMARDQMGDVTYFGTMMVHRGWPTGWCRAPCTRPRTRSARRSRSSAPPPAASIVSSVFFMCLADRVLVYGDCAVNPTPTPSSSPTSPSPRRHRGHVRHRAAGRDAVLLDGESARARTSTRSASHRHRARAPRPDLLIEGRSSTTRPSTRTSPDQAAGQPRRRQGTVFVFPDLNTGNNTYKAVQRSAGAVADRAGPAGAEQAGQRPVAGALVHDIVNTVAITAIQAQDPPARRDASWCSTPAARRSSTSSSTWTTARSSPWTYRADRRGPTA